LFQVKQAEDSTSDAKHPTSPSKAASDVAPLSDISEAKSVAPPAQTVKKSRFTVISGGSPTKGSSPDATPSPRGTVARVSVSLDDHSPVVGVAVSSSTSEDHSHLPSSTSSSAPAAAPVVTGNGNGTLAKPPHRPSSASASGTPTPSSGGGSGRTTPVTGAAGTKKNRSRFTVKTLSVDVSMPGTHIVHTCSNRALYMFSDLCHVI
jgi:hypothetical protein